MAITGIDTIEGKQIIAAGAVSAKSAEMAYNDENGNPITGYLTAVPEGYATEDWVTAQGYLTAHQDLSDYQTTADMVNYQTTAGMTAYQSAGEYYSASNPSGFLVADDITGKLDASVYAADSGNFLTAIPDTYLQNTDLSTEDGKVTAISGIPLSAGGDVPEGVMVESGLEYNAVNEISAYNGSAIAQYGAEKQWLVHDDTIVHISNSAQYAFGCNISALQRLMGIDETVLWSGSPTTFTAAFTASESISNFDKIKVSHIIYTDNEYIQENHEYESDAALLTNEINVGFSYIIDNGWKCWGAEKYHITNGTDFTIYRAGRNFIGPNTTAGQGYNDNADAQNGWIYKVVGIGRKA